MSRSSVLPIVAALAAPLLSASADEPPFVPLAEVRRRALEAHPRIAAADAAAAAAAERARSAGRPEDPELELETESFGGSGAASGFDAAETSLRLTQPLSPPGARGAAAEGARQEALAARAGADLARRELRRATDQAFHELAARQDLLALAHRRVELARRLAGVASDRAAAGAGSPLETLRAEADAGLAEADVARAEGGRERAAAALAALWGDPADVRVAHDPAAPLPDPPAPDGLRAAAARHPLLLQTAADASRAAAGHRAARAARFGTYGLMAGVQRFEETADTGITAGLTVSLPLWSRPGTTVAAAHHDLDAARRTAAAAAREAEAAIAAARATYARAREAADVLAAKSVPAARRAADGMLEGYRAGKFGLAAVLEAQAAAAEIEAEWIEARKEALLAWAELEYWSTTGQETTDLH